VGWISNQLVRIARFGSALEHIREEILVNKELPERIRPVEFLACAREHDIRVPAKLEQAVADNENDVAALQTNVSGCAGRTKSLYMSWIGSAAAFLHRRRMCQKRRVICQAKSAPRC